LVAHFQIGIVVLDQRYLIMTAHHVFACLVQVLQEAVIKLLAILLLLSFGIRFLDEVLNIRHFCRIVRADFMGFFWFKAPASRSLLMTRHHGPLLLQVLSNRVSLLTRLV
jgi:hypothetical protein